MRLSDAYNLGDLRPRATALAVIFIVLLGLLVGRLWYLQIWRGEEYRQFSDKNRFKLKKLYAPRGKILDREGKLLADNRPRFDVMFTRGFSLDVETEMKILRSIFDWPEVLYEERLRIAQRSSPYLARRIARDISWNELALIESKALELSGVDVEVLAVRDYLYGDAFFHVLGYTGEVDEQDLQRLSVRQPERNYRLGDQIGVIGAEARFEGELRGTDGYEFVVVDVRGRPVQRGRLSFFEQSSRIDAQAGKDIQLTLDLDLQLEAVRRLGDRRGAVVAIEPETGEILAMVSRPGLDPNLFTRPITGAELSEWRSRPDKPFLDRTLGEHYPPGSTYKLVMAAAALESGVITPETIINCPGSFRLGRRVWHDHNRAGFGRINLHEALMRSSNVFFFNVGLMMGLDTMAEWSRAFGLGRRTHLGHEVLSNSGKERLSQFLRFNSEQTGFIPSEAWIQRVGHTTVRAEIVNAGIGQGGFLTTITQLARMVSIIGNGGRVYQPQLLKRIVDDTKASAVEFQAVLETEVEFRPETLKVLREAMRAAVNDPGGTAPRVRLRHFSVGGKTGTSQVVALDRSREDEDREEFQHHALFVGLAPIENPKIAVAVIVEHGGSGGRAAGPIAGAMMQNYLQRKMPREASLGRH